MHKFSSFSSLLNITLDVSDGLSVHHQESKTVHTASGVYNTEITEMDKITIVSLRCDIPVVLVRITELNSTRLKVKTQLDYIYI